MEATTTSIPFQFPLRTTSSSSPSSGQNPSSKQDQSLPLVFHFPPPPFYDDSSNHHHNQILFQNQVLPIPSNPYGDVDRNPNQPPQGGKRRGLGVVPRRRAGKKDRHSKICTAQGIRDRRMRLSLQAARKFFDLQDMLGYDKASKTIEWLFQQSKKAIEELSESSNFSNSDARSESFVSECEVVSGIEESCNKNDNTNEEVEEEEEEQEEEDEEKKNPRNDVVRRNTRESREKARARARWRTREKMMNRLSSQWQDKNPNESDQKKLGFSAGFENANLELISFSRVSSYGMEDSGTIEKLLGIQGSSSSSPYMDPNHGFMGFLQTWDL